MDDHKPVASYPDQHAEQRNVATCAGCGRSKPIGTITCWDCFRGRNGLPAYKYWAEEHPTTPTFDEWVAECQQIRDRRQT
jgi:hypothetical protein